MKPEVYQFEIDCFALTDEIPDGVDNLYILSDCRDVVRAPYYQDWLIWIEDNMSPESFGGVRIAFTKLPSGDDIITVFLGLDHRLGNGPPLVFETACLFKNSGWFDVMERYSTYEEAVAGHNRIVSRIASGENS